MSRTLASTAGAGSGACRPGVLLDDRLLVGLLRVADQDPEQEAVELGLGEWVRPLVLDRVLGRDDDERARQRVPHPVDRDLTLLHRLEERRLDLRGSPVDLVGEDHVREDRPLAGTRALVVVGFSTMAPMMSDGSMSGRELDPLERELEALGEAPDEERLRDARDPLEQDVPLGDERDREQSDDLLVADHAAADGELERPQGLLGWHRAARARGRGNGRRRSRGRGGAPGRRGGVARRDGAGRGHAGLAVVSRPTSDRSGARRARKRRSSSARERQKSSRSQIPPSRRRLRASSRSERW